MEEKNSAKQEYRNSPVRLNGISNIVIRKDLLIR